MLNLGKIPILTANTFFKGLGDAILHSMCQIRLRVLPVYGLNHRMDFVLDRGRRRLTGDLLITLQQNVSELCIQVQRLSLTQPGRESEPHFGSQFTR